MGFGTREVRILFGVQNSVNNSGYKQEYHIYEAEDSKGCIFVDYVIGFHPSEAAKYRRV